MSPGELARVEGHRPVGGPSPSKPGGGPTATGRQRQPSSADARFWIALSLIAVLGMVRASISLGSALREDEAFRANVVRLPLPEMWEALQNDNILLLYYLILKPWTLLFGESEAALRFPSVLAFGGTIFAVGRTAQAVMGARAGLMAALLAVLSTGQGVTHGSAAGPYAFLGLLVAVSTLTAFRLMSLIPASCPTPTLHALLVGLHVLGLLTHPLYAFFMGACTLAAAWRPRPTFFRMLAVSALALAVYGVVNWPLLRTAGPLPHTAWMKAVSLRAFISGIGSVWGKNNTLLLLAYLGGLVWWRRDRVRAVLAQPVVLVGATLLVLLTLTPFLVSQIRPVFLESRTPIVFLPMACVLAAVTLCQLDTRALSAVVFGWMALTCLISSIQTATRPAGVTARSSVEYVASRADCADFLIYGSVSGSEAQYYLRRLNAPDCLRGETFPLDTARHPGWIHPVGLLAQRGALESEARRTAARLASSVEGRLWLFYGEPAVTDILRRELEPRFGCQEPLGLLGTFFDSVIVYTRC